LGWNHPLIGVRGYLWCVLISRWWLSVSRAARRGRGEVRRGRGGHAEGAEGRGDGATEGRRKCGGEPGADAWGSWVTPSLTLRARQEGEPTIRGRIVGVMRTTLETWAWFGSKRSDRFNPEWSGRTLSFHHPCRGEDVQGCRVSTGCAALHPWQLTNAPSGLWDTKTIGPHEREGEKNPLPSCAATRRRNPLPSCTTPKKNRLGGRLGEVREDPARSAGLSICSCSSPC
jgi:hypothetical protein